MKKILILFSVLSLSGCYSLRVQNMTVQNGELHYNSTGKTLNVTASEEFKANFINAEQFSEALVNSLVNSGLFDVNGSQYDYVLSAEMKHYFQPPAGFDLHSDFIVRYSMTNVKDTLYDQTLESHSLATVKDAFSGTKRSKISYERAMKQNIEMFLEDISKFDFK